MHPGEAAAPPAPAAPAAPPAPPAPWLDFFHKLGYSTAQVQAVQQSVGASSDTNTVLGRLVRAGAGRDPPRGPPTGPPLTTMSVVVPRGEPPPVTPTVLLPLPGRGEESGGEEEDVLRAVVIDGSNVAMSHGNKEVFSCLGIQLAVNFFLDRGHDDVTVFVPSWRKEQPRPDVPITDQHILRDLERRKIMVFTPSRRVGGKRVVCNDDCFIVKHAFESDGIVVSNDLYRDLQGEKPEWKRFIEERLLMYSFVNDKFMPPDDPLGRHGPTLDNFLRKFPKTPKKQLCPYGRKCTYGIKCKFLHPERLKQSTRLLADELRDCVRHPISVPKLAAPGEATPGKAAPSKAAPGKAAPGKAAPYEATPGLSLLLVEDMAKKLTLGHDSSSSRKEKSELLKPAHRPGKKSSPRRDKVHRHLSSDCESAPHGGSHEQLDSGLGSIEGSPVEPSYGGRHAGPQQFCCSHGPPSLGAPPAFHPCCGTDVLPYAHPGYHGYCTYPVGMAAYGQPKDFQHSRIHQQRPPYWSDPFPAHPAAVRTVPGEHRRWEPGLSPSGEQREVVRKKLLAIFSSQLVDAAMDMFPQLMDPQLLVAEILALQSQNRSLR